MAALRADPACKDPVEGVIREVLSRPGWWKTHSYNINDGLCDLFASDVLKALGTKGLKGGQERWTECPEYPGHVWVSYQGRHYDAEAPAGVARWQQLSIFRRYRLGQPGWCTWCGRPFRALLVRTRGSGRACRERLCPPCSSISRCKKSA